MAQAHTEFALSHDVGGEDEETVAAAASGDAAAGGMSSKVFQLSISDATGKPGRSNTASDEQERPKGGTEGSRGPGRLRGHPGCLCTSTAPLDAGTVWRCTQQDAHSLDGDGPPPPCTMVRWRAPRANAREPATLAAQGVQHSHCAAFRGPGARVGRGFEALPAPRPRARHGRRCFV